MKNSIHYELIELKIKITDIKRKIFNFSEFHMAGLKDATINEDSDWSAYDACLSCIEEFEALQESLNIIISEFDIAENTYEQHKKVIYHTFKKN